MATRIYMDKRSAKKDGTYPLKFSVTYKNVYTLIPTGINLLSDYWDEKNNKVIKHPLRASLNQMIKERFSAIEFSLFSLQVKAPKSGKELREIIEKAISGEAPCKNENLFCGYFEDFMSSKKAKSTQELYAYTLGRIKAYSPDWESLSFDDITYKWLTSFSDFLKSCKTNTVSIHQRNIRAVFNDAIKNDIITCYPFKKFKIESESTPKRSLLPEQLVELRDYECEEHQRRYRDLFMLIFYLIGINTKDLFYLTEKNIVNGRIEYRRAKTGRWYSIKIEPEVAELIEKYKGEKHLLYVLDDYANYKDFQHRMNENLQKIGEVSYEIKTIKGKRRSIKKYNGFFQELTTYWARHTWATIAHKIGISKDIISMALGHSFGCKVTDIYIDFDREKVDEANRKVIDYINSLGK